LAADRKIRGNRQSGAVLVEFAVSVSLFLLLTLGVIEILLLVFDLARANEMTRQLSRIAITSDPVCDIWNSDCGGSGSSGLTCPVPGGSVVVNLGEVDTSAQGQGAMPTGGRMLERAQIFLPTVQPSQIRVTYACSGSGYADRPRPIPLVSVGLQNFTRPFLLGSFIGLGNGIEFPTFENTRLGEDLYTEG